MTDERDPATEGPSLEGDTTSRVPTPGLVTAPAIPATPVVPGGPVGSRSRRRWAIGIAFVALVALTSIAVALFLTGRSSTATVLGYVPGDTVVYGEVRLDLPGDQRRAVGEFLSKFPGFADQAALDAKLDEILDQLVRDATTNGQSYTTDIKPWFDGELAFSVGTLPPAAPISGADPALPPDGRGLVLVSIKDPALAQAWFDAAIAKVGAKTTTESYNGSTLTVFQKSGGITAALAVIEGKVAVAGDIVSVKAAVDSKGASPFASLPGPRTAIDSATGDHVGFVYVGLRALVDWSNQMSSAVAPPGGTLNPAMSAAMLKVIPDWGAYWLRIERDAIVMEAVAPKAAAVIGPTDNRVSPVVEHIPGTAVVAATSNDYGKTLKQMLDLYRSEPTLKPMLDQLDSALGLVGGEDAALGWAGDTAVVVNLADGTPEGGLIAIPTDKAAAEHLFTSLRSFIALAGAQQGLSVSDETYNGTTITTVDLGDLATLTGGTGAAGSIPLPTGHLQIAYAVTDQVVVVGSGPGFVKHVLDTTAATSLKSNDRYKKLADRAGAGTGTTFVDITTIRGLIEKAAADATDLTGPDALAKYNAEIKPFLAPFDAIVASGSVTGNTTRSVIYITLN
jgi:hypothetical protein